MLSSADFVVDLLDRLFSHFELIFSLNDIVGQVSAYLFTLFAFLPGFLQPICFGMLIIAILMWVVNLF